MAMTPQIDHEAVTFARPMEQPEGRFGSEHIVRDEIPAINPEIIDLLDRQDQAEVQFLARQMAVRKGSLAVADTVSIAPQTGLYL